MTAKKKNKKPLLDRLQKYESLIAGTALVIGLALFAGFVTALIIKTKAELDSFVMITSSAQWENTSYYGGYYPEDKIVFSKNPSGDVIVNKFKMFTGVYLTADSMGTTVLVDEDNKKVNQVVFITDIGDRITATSSRNGVSFVMDDNPVREFKLDGYCFDILDDSVEIDGFALATFGELDFSDKTTTAETTTTTPETTTPDNTTTTIPGTTVTEGTTHTTSKTESTTNPTTTTKKPITTTVTTTKKPQATTTTATSYKTDDEFIQEVLELVNAERKKAGLKEIKGMIALDKAATIRAQEITGAKENFSHTRPDGNKWYTIFSETGLNPKSAGENLAAGQTSPEMVVSDWLASETHKANILDPDFDYIGLGYVKYNGHYYWAQLFASF